MRLLFVSIASTLAVGSGLRFCDSQLTLQYFLIMLAASLLLFRFLASRKVGCRGVYRGDLETNRESQDRRPDPELSFFALEVSTDELLGLHSANGKNKAKSNGRKPSRRVLRRL